MSQKISWILIATIFLAFLGGGWYFYQNVFQKLSDPIILVPDDVAVLVEVSDVSQLSEALSAAPSISAVLNEWPGIDAFQEFQKDIQNFMQSSTDVHQKMLLSFHKEGVLVLLSGAPSDISLLTNDIQIKEKTFENEYYKELNRNGHQLAISEKRGILFISTQAKLLAHSIQHFKKSNQFSESEDFQKLQKISGKRSDAHVYVQYRYLQDWLGESNSTDPVFEDWSKIAQWTALDLNLKSTELMLNGYSILSDTSSDFLQILQAQESVGMSIAQQFPYRTQAYVHLSLDDYAAFYENWSRFLKNTEEGTQLQSSLQKMNARIGKSPAAFHEQWWAGEMAWVKTEEQKEYAVFLSKSGREAFKILSNLAHLSQPSLLTVEYQDYKIKELNFKNLLFTHFGPWFHDFDKTYFSIVGELVIFAHSIDDLKAYIDLLSQGYILQKNESYTAFSDNLSPHLNYTYYISRPPSPNKIFHFLNSQSDQKWSKTQFFTKDLSAFSLQMNWKNDMVYTGVFAGLKGKKKKTSSDWQVLLESDIIKGPFKVEDHTDGSSKYIVFDDYRQMYLINQQGDIVWKKQLEEKPMSDVYEVDYFKNGKIQYLFNTPNYLYMIDLTGAFVKDYPIKFNAEASAGLALFDYNNDKDYRILIPAKNGQIYNYEKEGSLLKDWKSKNTNKSIAKPLHHVVANSKDYLIAESEDGDAIMFDRRGRVRMEIRKSFENALGSDFYANRTNSKGMMITTNQQGKLIYIPEKGDVKQTDFGDFKKDHFFIYNDFTGNGNYDFIYLDENELKVFDRFKKTIVSYVFENNILHKPKIYTLAGRKVLCVLDAKKQKLYLFNSDGIMASNIAANSDYLIDVQGNKAFVLAASGKSLKKYPLF